MVNLLPSYYVFYPFGLSVFWQDSQFRKKLLELLQSTIVQDPALSSNLASYQIWVDRNGLNASLNDLSKQLTDVRIEVSEYTV